MIRNLHFYKWLVAVVVLICSTITMSAQNMETSVLNLKAGSVIKIYPRPNFNNNYYALACSGDGERLESYHDAGSGDEWTLEDAGNGYCYLKNDNGCYWSQVSSSSEVLKCTINKSSAVKILFTWDADYYGVRIWNEKNCLGLIARSQGNGYNHFKWDSNIYDKTSSAPIFSIAVLKEGRGDPFSGGENKEIILNRIKYKLHCNKTAEVVKNYYYGDIVIPETVKYNNFTYKITSIEDDCFKDCSSLTSISLPSGITSLGRYCFEFCSSLTSIELPSGITSLGESCFSLCSNLKSMLCLAVEPPSCTKSVVNCTMRLYVPKESVENYKQSDAWGRAKGIYPLYPTISVSLAKEVSVNKAKPTKLEYTILPENAGTKELEWSSENPEVATVDANGVVTGKKLGKTIITAKTKDGTDITVSTTLTVLPLVETMAFAESSVSIVKTEDKTIKLTLEPVEADKHMVWTSSDESVATVVQNMNAVYPLEAIVVAHKVGKATIKAEAQDGSGMSATCEVEVTPLMASDLSLQTASVVRTIPTQLEAKVSPADADNKKLKWTSLTPDVATITEDGMMTGLKMGTAKVKAETTDGSNLSCVFEVQVTGLPVSTISLPAESSIVKTESMKLEYSILPLASDNQKLKWSSNATYIASVDENTGVITAHKVGDAIITATATDGSGISASTTIRVTPLKVSQIEMPKEISLLHTLS